MEWNPFNDFYLFRWNKYTAILFLIALALWLWRVDRDMKSRGQSGIFNFRD